MSKPLRALSVLVAVAGTALLVWVAATLVWGEPITGFVTARAQAALRHQLAQEQATAASLPHGREALRTRARAFEASLHDGQPVGVIAIPRLQLRMVVVQGTTAADLARGPGHYELTPVPGLGGTVAIAGHRTTYLQPFRHIDKLTPGDSISLAMPYGVFHYRVYARAIVSDRDWSIIRRRPVETLVLSACHPLYSASHRIVVFARLREASSGQRA